MSFFLDLDEDFDVFDNTEEIRLTQAGTSSSVKVHALRRQISVREAAASGGAYTSRDVQFSIRRSDVCETPPGVGSLITSKCGELFTIFGVDLATLKSRYRCWCREPVMQSNLDQILQIDEPQYLLDTMDAPYVKYFPLHQNVRGKVYTISDQSEVAREERQANPTIRIYVAGVTEVPVNARVQEGNNYYNVSKVTTPMLGGLIVLEATTARTPQAM